MKKRQLKIDSTTGNLTFTLDNLSGVPYYRQIIKQVEMAIADGRLQKSNQLPTVRSLAVELQVNPNTVAKAYNELEIRGIVHTQQGTGTFVSDKTIEFTHEERSKMLKSLIENFLSNASSYGITPKEIIQELVSLNEKEDD